MFKKIIFISAVIFLFTCAAATAYGNELPAFARIGGNGVRLRAEAGTDARILLVMEENTVLSVLGRDGEWFKVMYQNQVGYVFGEYVVLPDNYEVPLIQPVVQPDIAPDLLHEPGVINDHGVRLRAESNTDSKIITTMSKGTQLTVTGREDEWYAVLLNGTPGFVYDVYVTLSETLESIDEVGYINADGVRLRESNNTDSEILTVMPQRTTLTVMDKVDDWYKVKSGDKTGYVLGTYVTLGAAPGSRPANNPASSGASAAAPSNIQFTPGGKAELVDWSDAKGIMSTGTRAIVTDVVTGISFEIKVLSSGNHADVEPITASDTASILAIRGNYSWTPRAIYVTVDGRTMAASCNGMPHSGSTISDNNFPGHFCIHFYNSKNHYNNALDPGHQGQVAIAYES